jgi:acyl-CoA thioester hydrolase
VTVATPSAPGTGRPGPARIALVRHLFRCPIRWADLDMLGHVNNVTYVDYLQEARVDLIRTLRQDRAHHPGGEADLEDGVVVVRHEITYLAPLGLRFRPVEVECWVTEVRGASFTLAYEVFHDDPDVEGGRRVYVRATSLLAPYVFRDERPRRLTAEEKEALHRYAEPAERPSAPRVPAVDRAAARHFDLHVRFSDVDLYRHVNNVTYVEYFQEARVRLMADLTRDTGIATPQFVVAQTDIDYLRPLLLRPTPYDVWSRVARVGTRSFTVEAEIADGDEPLARARVAMVFFDAATQRSVEPDPAFRALLERR